MQLKIYDKNKIAYFVIFKAPIGDSREVEIERGSFKMILEFSRDADLELMLECIKAEING